MAFENRIFLLYAILAVLCICGIGVFVSEGSAIGITACIIGTILVFGLGFRKKQKLRQRNQ